ncbi:MAG TPA: ATP-dependent RNA helicase HrpA [Gammaproteobacteria bacterium]|nr:ATP-dependent RNA helicase HrpA [Gammaproteobacteria bacterium]
MPDPSLSRLRAELKSCMAADFFRLSRRLNQLGKNPAADKLLSLQQAIEASQQRRAQRSQQQPDLNYPEDLPVSGKRAEIAEAIRQHQVILVCGETGSGKTTQLPKICLEAGRGIDGLIGHTQPRRLAARTVALRIAEELKSALGTLVGFQTRFQKNLSDQNRIKLMTDGILLSEMQRDRWLNQYDTLIIDEAHERSLNIDFLLGYLKQLLAKRRNLKLIITSATIDAARMADHFDHAPIIEVTGRSYPVDILYHPMTTADDDQEPLDLNQAIDQAIDETQQQGRGDILVFLPGEREIHEVSRTLRHRREQMDILPLYARLNAADQQRIFHPGGRTRVILSTNVAETSLTVPGIRYVIDSGLARISRYSWHSKIQRLPIEKISQASANQRAGRCGRTGPGVCIRLYDEDDFINRSEFTDPEIQRTNLAAVILQMAALRLDRIEKFPFIDTPDPRLIRDGYRLLGELHAVDDRRKITPLGKQLARLPIDPRLGRMLIAASTLGATAEVLIIVTALAVQDPRERPFDKKQAADEKHARFNDPHSDFISLINLWNDLEAQFESLSRNAFRKYCKKEFMNFRRWWEWRDTHRQLKLALAELKITLNPSPAKYLAIHQAVLSGLLDHIGFKEEKHLYLGCRNRKFSIFPGSGVKGKTPKWIMAAEITETSRLFARTVAQIQPEWVEHVGQHLLKHSYSEPHWQTRSARVGGYEKLTLYGLVINPKRPVNYAQIDPALARELFIRHALVYGQWSMKLPVIEKNRSDIESIEDIETRTRRRDILIDEEDLYVFYHRKLPDNIHSGEAFRKWYRSLKDPKILRIHRNDLLRDDIQTLDVDQAFPKYWEQQGLQLPLHYQFEPGHEADGVTLRIPLAVLPQVDADRCDWLVPGLLEEKFIALIKALPKKLRKNFVPAPDFAHAIKQTLSIYEGNLFEQMSDALNRMTGVHVTPDDWNLTLEPHLIMRFEIIDENSKVIKAGRSLTALRDTLAQQLEKKPAPPSLQSFEREQITHWDFGELPDYIECEEAGYRIRRYPALSAEKQGIALRLFDQQPVAEQAMQEGLLALIRLQLKQDIRYLDKNIPNLTDNCLKFSALGQCRQFKDDLIDSSIQRCFLNEPSPPKNEAAFSQRLKTGRDQLVTTANELSALAGEILGLYHKISQQIRGNLPLSAIEAAADVKSQLNALVYPGFLRRTPATQLGQLPRYLKAMQIRLEKVPNAPDKDRMRRVELAPLLEYQSSITPEKYHASTALQNFRWQLEELRVSLFAQELGTRQRVSIKRLEKLWKSI